MTGRSPSWGDGAAHREADALVQDRSIKTVRSAAHVAEIETQVARDALGRAPQPYTRGQMRNP